MKKKKKKIRIRRTWKIHPATKIKNSNKIYKRSKEKQKVKQYIKKGDSIE